MLEVADATTPNASVCSYLLSWSEELVLQKKQLSYLYDLTIPVYYRIELAP